MIRSLFNLLTFKRYFNFLKIYQAFNDLLTLNETKIVVITLIIPEDKTQSRARALGLGGDDI